MNFILTLFWSLLLSSQLSFRLCSSLERQAFTQDSSWAAGGLQEASMPTSTNRHRQDSLCFRSFCFCVVLWLFCFALVFWYSTEVITFTFFFNHQFRSSKSCTKKIASLSLIIGRENAFSEDPRRWGVPGSLLPSPSYPSQGAEDTELPRAFKMPPRCHGPTACAASLFVFCLVTVWGSTCHGTHEIVKANLCDLCQEWKDRPNSGCQASGQGPSLLSHRTSLLFIFYPSK